MKAVITLSILLLAMLSLHAQPALAQNDSPCNQGRSEPDPRNAQATCFPELGRINGTILKCDVPPNGEEYGRRINAVGDVNGDSLADWIVEHQLCNEYTKGNPFPIELLLYKGIRGKLPDVSNAQRIGPTEINSITRFLAAGDWDNDGHPDIAVSMRTLGDTSFGNTDLNYDIGLCVVFWGNAAGTFSLDDTTRLSNGLDAWIGPYDGLSSDFDGDHIDDLLLHVNGNGYAAGKRIDLPRLAIFRGHDRQRWGRNATHRTADWIMWNRPPLVKLGLVDQDGDGAKDIVFYSNTDGGTGDVSVLYGKPGGGFPDTTEFETTSLLYANGHYSIFSDVTGDHIPELLVSCGSENQIKVFIGLKGQRLKQQYGTGHDPAHPDSARWWGHPWASIWQPYRIDSLDWRHSQFPLFDLDDGNMDGVGDIWSVSWPYLMCYSGGATLDSLADGLVNILPGGGVISTARLGDIDGSGIATIAVSNDVEHTGSSSYPGGIIFFKPTKAMQASGSPRRLPDGTGTADVDKSLDHNLKENHALGFHAFPNPVGDEIHLTWNTTPARGPATLLLSDECGAEIRRLTVPAGQNTLQFLTAGMTTGWYLITLSIDDRRSTLPVVIR